MLLLGAALLYFLFDGEKIQSRLQQEVQSRYQRELNFDGPIGLSVLPRIGLTLPSTTLSQRGKRELFAQLDSARVSVAWLPLLRGKLAIDTITIDGLKATLVRYHDGQTNLDDLLEANFAATPAPASSSSSAAPSDIELGGIKLSRAQLTLHDFKGGKLARVSEFELASGRIAPGTQIPIDLSAHYWLDRPAIEGRIKASGKLKLDPPATRYGVSHLIATSHGTLDGTAFDLKLDAPQLSLGPKTASAKTLALWAKLGGASPLDAKLIIDNLIGNSAALDTRRLDLAVTQKHGDRSSTLHLAGPAQASMTERSIHWPQFKGELDLTAATLPGEKLTAPITGKMNLDGIRELAQLEFATTLDGGALMLKADLAGFAKPSIRFDLDATKLDLDPWLPPATTTASAPAPQADRNGIGAAQISPTTPAKPIDLGFLNALQLQGKLRIATLNIRGIRANQVKARLSAATGRLDIAPLSANLYGGTLAGTAWAHTNQRLGTSFQLDGVDLAPLLRDAGLKDRLEGRATTHTELTASGTTERELMQSLAGHLTARINQGALRGINLERILTATRRGQEGVQAERSAAGDKTEFSELSASFSIAQGIARNNDLKAISSVLRVSGAGAIDLPAASIDYTLRAALAPGAQRAASLTVPVKLSGPLADIHYTIDWAAVAAAALKSRIERRLTPGASGSSSENPIDSLKRWFKR